MHTCHLDSGRGWNLFERGENKSSIHRDRYLATAALLTHAHQAINTGLGRDLYDPLSRSLALCCTEEIKGPTKM